MILHYLKNAALAACLLGSVSESAALDLQDDSSLESWFTENRSFVETQFRLLALPVESSYDPEVIDQIIQYLAPGRRETERMLGRAHYYLPIFESHLEAKGLPASLKYLPVVESGLFPQIKSMAGATGLWQFMYVTAIHLDLKIDDWIDERCDPRRSSEAATRLLDDLKKRFGDWNLALAAYNCGPRQVDKAIQQVGRADYQAIKHLLPKQTRRYITKFKAAAYVANYYDFFGLNPRLSKHLAGNPVRLELKSSMSFEDISRLSRVSLQTLRVLNPEYQQDLVPAGKRPPWIVLPEQAANLLLAATDPEATNGQWKKEHTPNNQTDAEGLASEERPAPANDNRTKMYGDFAASLFDVFLGAISGSLPQPEPLPVGEDPADFYFVRIQRQEFRFSGLA